VRPFSLNHRINTNRYLCFDLGFESTISVSERPEIVCVLDLSATVIGRLHFTGTNLQKKSSVTLFYYVIAEDYENNYHRHGSFLTEEGGGGGCHAAGTHCRLRSVHISVHHGWRLMLTYGCYMYKDMRRNDNSSGRARHVSLIYSCSGQLRRKSKSHFFFSFSGEP
jgi:hypothetical protein